MTSRLRSRSIALCSITVLLSAIAIASLIPAQLRTGLNWQTEHFLVYFAATAILIVAWPRPFLVAAALAAVSGLLELAQGLTPEDRIPDLPTALSGAAGALTAVVLAKLAAHLHKLALARAKQI